MQNRIISVGIVDGSIVVTYQDGSTEILGPVGDLDPEELQEAVRRNSGDIAAVRRDIAALQQADTGYTADITQLKSDRTEMQGDISSLEDDVADLKNDLSEKADKTDALSAYIVETETGAVASFTDGADDVPVKDLTVAIEPVQSGSGDPSPTNVRPISGWTGANVSANGINQFNKNTVLDGFIDESTGAFKPLNTYKSTDYIKVIAGASYYVKSEQTGGLWGAWYDKNKTYIRGEKQYANKAITAPSNAEYVRFTVATSQTGNVDTFAVNYPATDTAYHAYNGSSVSVNWQTEAGTVYGGTLDVTTGVLTATDANIASYNGETLPSTWISDRDIYADGTTPTTGAQVVYKLATPQTYQLTPQEVQTILGQNNIFADCGDSTVQYRADTKLYIDKVLSA